MDTARIDSCITVHKFVCACMMHIKKEAFFFEAKFTSALNGCFLILSMATKSSTLYRISIHVNH